jgi:septal ring factor EnvC (AmiA/AmiB activator)
MNSTELERLADKVEKLVEDLKAARVERQSLLAERKKLEEKMSGLEKHLRLSQKEGSHLSELIAQNKAYRKKSVALKSKVVSMLAKVEGLQ